MPDLIIKGMEKMPSACCECPCVSGNICAAENKRPTFDEWYEFMASPSAFMLQILALGGYDVVWILTGE